ncbi:MAG: sigma-70 family RNA polymerase sigma factor [Gemmataceae bacterium]
MSEAKNMARHPLAAILRRLRGPINLAPDSDFQLLQRFATGRDDEAFAELVRRYGPTVWGVCRRGVRDPNDAEDVFQTTFLVLAKKPTAVRPGQSLGGWLHGVAVRASAQLRRGVARRNAHETEAARRNVTKFSSGPDATGEWLDEELRNLPARYRDPLVLCHVRGLDVAEAANELGCPANTVKTRLARGREMLKERLVRRGITMPMVALTVAAPAELSAATVQLATAPTLTGVRPGVLTLLNATLTRGITMKLKLLAAAVVVCGVGVTGLAFSGQSDGLTHENPKTAPAPVDPVNAVPPKIEPLEWVDAEGVVNRVTPSTEQDRLGSLGIGNKQDGEVNSVIHAFGPKAGQSETRITKISDGKLIPAKFEDITVGCRVQVRLSQRGTWLRSKPPQGTAAEVRIIAPAEFKITSQRATDIVAVQSEKDRTIFDIKSPEGISTATIERTKEKWPDVVIVRLRLQALEGFWLQHEKVKLKGGVSFQQEKPPYLLVEEDKNNSKPGEKAASWGEIIPMGSDGKPTEDRLLKDGYFEIPVPKAFLEGNPKEIRIHWINFYRR